MKYFFSNTILLSLLCLFLSVGCQSDSISCNDSPVTLKNGTLWEDQNGNFINAHGGGMYYENGTYYWFGEHKVPGDEGNTAQVGVHCYKSTNLQHWVDCGIALRVNSTDPTHPIAKGCILERPKVIYNPKTKKYVMWFHLELKGKGYGSAFSGVATSDSVTGPYQFLRASRVNPQIWAQNISKDEQNLDNLTSPTLSGSWFPKEMKENALFKRDFNKGQMARDMTLFVDDDGKAYHIYASEENGTLQIAQLNEDFTDHNGIYTRNFIGRFMEAPAIFKRQKKYYLIASGCTGWHPNAARSAVATNILGPWMELKNPCIGKNAHITFGGQSTFIFKVQNRQDCYVLMLDLWRPNNAIDGRYQWIPLKFDGDQIILENSENFALPAN